MKTLSVHMVKHLLAQSIFASLATLALAHGEHAGPNALWSDSKGLVEVGQCAVGQDSDVNLRLSQSAHLQTKNAGLVTLSERTLLRVDIKQQNAPKLEAEIVTLAQNMVQKQASPVAGKGLVKQEELQTIDDSVIEIQDGKLIESLKGQFLQVSMNDDQYASVVCNQNGKQEKYFVFNVYAAHNMDPVSRIGINVKELQIFRNVKIHSTDEAEDLLTAQESKVQSLPGDQNTNAPAPGIWSRITSQFASGGADAKVAEVLGSRNAGSSAETMNTQMTAQFKSNAMETERSVLNKTVVTGEEEDIDEEADESEEAAQAAKENEELEKKAEAETVLTTVICTANDPKLAVRDEKMAKVLFYGDRFEEVKAVQDWDGKTDAKLIEILFPNRKAGANTGWVKKEYVKLKSECAPLQQKLKAQESFEAKATKQANAAIIGKIKGLDDPNCCTFPTLKRPTTSYKEGMRRFQWRRGKHRLHAACDLYRLHGDAAVAVAPGKVIRGTYYFYQGVYAVEVLHSGGFVARYGEIMAKVPKGIKLGSVVSPGQTIGFIGTVNSGCCKPMLHFELYKGTVSGPLSQARRRPFQRRADLLNPTNYLSKWEKKQFGVSY